MTDMNEGKAVSKLVEMKQNEREGGREGERDISLVWSGSLQQACHRVWSQPPHIHLGSRTCATTAGYKHVKK
jgi:hypothetical protein